MWIIDNASTIGASDMDRRACPSYEAGFDACDPLGSVLEWSGRGPARVLRRRCRSEGVDRTPYNVPLHRSADGIPRQNKALPNKNHFTLNTALEAPCDRYRDEYSSTAAVNGDYIMAHNQRRHQSNHPENKQHKRSPITTHLANALSNTKVEDSHLPKVEELLEKIDHDMDTPVAKQPLKSILNNPLPKSPPQGILKKPKSRQYQEHKDPARGLEGRRRQRASSESDNFYGGFHMTTPISGYESRLNTNMKRAKDSTGTGYSYGSAVAALGHPTVLKPPKEVQKRRSPVGDTYNAPPHLNEENAQIVRVLRTTAINEPLSEDTIVDLPHQDSAIPQLLETNDSTVSTAKKIVKTVKKKPKAKPKVPKMKAKTELNGGEGEIEDGHSRSPSVDDVPDWKMETDALLAEIEKLQKSSPPPIKREDPSPATNGTKVTTKPIPPVAKKAPSKVSSLNLPEHILNCLRPSLFPRVPPYLKFIGHDEAHSLKIPMAIQKHLKWKLTSITPIVVKKTLTNSGFRLVKSECDTAECPQEETIDWIGIWGKHMKSLMFRAIKDGQKMNHFPGTFQIGRKDRLWRNLQKLATKFGVDEFGIMPKTYVLPHDLKFLKHDWEKHAQNNEKWIIKPPASARGTGIRVVSRWTQIPKKRSVVVQRYVSKPYLINGSKFDMRLYVLVTSVHPLRIYLHKDGLARFASVKYNNEIANLNDRYMHLTNYSINRLSKNYTPNEDFAACEGHKWTLQTLFHYLKHDRKVDTDALWESMKDLVIKTIIAGEGSISALTKANVTSRYNCYELFGIDVLLDEDLKPWLLEVNISPSLHSASPLDIHVKGPLVTTVLNIAQFQIPQKTNLDVLTKEKTHNLAGLPYDSRLYTIYLSKEERDKHIIYTNMEERDLYLRDILSTLTPDDVRHLIQAEDELTQAGDMERVFPTNDTHKYLNYLSGPRYYNRLFDAWETRYTLNRYAGHEMLRNLCDIGYHLEVPPVPLKNDVDAPSPEASERPSIHSVASVGPTASSASVSAAGRTCGDVLPQPAVPPPLEPRA